MLVVLICTGCASQPPAVLNLNPALRADQILVTEVISYKTEKIGPMGTPWQIGLLPGTYTAEKENELGVFYRGEGRSIWARRDIQEEGPLYIYTGGIWISKGSGLLRLYSYYDSEIHTARSLKEYDLQVGNAATEGLDALTNSNIDVAAATRKPVIQTAVGAALGAAIVSAAIQADAGKINLFEDQWGSNDPNFIAQMQKYIARSRELPNTNSSTRGNAP